MGWDAVQLAGGIEQSSLLCDSLCSTETELGFLHAPLSHVWIPNRGKIHICKAIHANTIPSMIRYSVIELLPLVDVVI